MNRTELKIESKGSMEVWPGIMRWEVDELCKQLDPIEVAEAVAYGSSPQAALQYAMMTHLDCTGLSYSVRNGGLTRGAFGYDATCGLIWAIFASNLTFSEQRTIIKATPRWTKQLVTHAGGKLSNAVSSVNIPAIKWIGLTKCFDFEPYEWKRGGLNWLPFTTKPLAEMPQ